MMLFRKYFLILLIILGAAACNKEKNPVPSTYVDIWITDIDSDSRYTDLRVPYGAVNVKQGDKCWGYKCNGVVLFRAKLEGAYDDFRAFDRTCTFEAGSIQMEIDQGFSDQLICPGCGSIFSMIGGYMVQGPAKHPLREFYCEYYDGDLWVR